MGTERIVDYIADGQALFIDIYKDKPKLNAWLAAYLLECNVMEGVLQDVLVGRTVDNAVGVNLVIVGKLVGQAPIGPNDDVYRLFIRTRIRANRSQGQSSDIIDVAVLATDGAVIIVTDLYPASVIVDIVTPLSPLGITLAPFIAQILNETRGAGVALSLHYTDSSNPFRFADGDVEQAGPDGFGDVAGTTGGDMVAAF